MRRLDRITTLVSLVLIALLISLISTVVIEYFAFKSSSLYFAGQEKPLYSESQRREAVEEAATLLRTTLENRRPEYADCKLLTTLWIDEAKAEADAKFLLAAYRALPPETQLTQINFAIVRLIEIYSEIIYECG